MHLKKSTLESVFQEILLNFNERELLVSLKFRKSDDNQYTFFIVNKSNNLTEDIFYITIIKTLPLLNGDKRVLVSLDYRFNNYKIVNYDDTNKLNMELQQYLESSSFANLRDKFITAEYLFRVSDRTKDYLSLYDNPSRVCTKVTENSVNEIELRELILGLLENSSKTKFALVVFDELSSILDAVSSEKRIHVLFNLAIKLDKLMKNE